MLIYNKDNLEIATLCLLRHPVYPNPLYTEIQGIRAVTERWVGPNK